MRLGAELHDIGKIGTREAVLNKPGPLTEEEFLHITEHTVLGEKILAPLARENPTVLRIVRHHHERMDGRGFPDRLHGEADSDRGPDRLRGGRLRRHDHQPGLPRLADAGGRAARSWTAAWAAHFDPEVVRAFKAAFPDPAVLPLAV